MSKSTRVTSKKAAKKTARRWRWSRIEPAPFVGLLVTVAVLALLNMQLVVGRFLAEFGPEPVMAASTTPPPAPATTDKRPRVVVPVLGLDAPIVYGITSVNDEAVQKGLERGVVHFGNSPLPGEPGNAVFVGHSSNQPWAPGDYKFVFATLDRLNPSDRIYLYFEGVRYTYEVTGKKVVKPSDVSVLERTPEPTATFITCTPVGTNLNRLIVQTKMVDPAPKTADIAQESAPELNSTLPGGSYNAFQAVEERLR